MKPPVTIVSITLLAACSARPPTAPRPHAERAEPVASSRPRNLALAPPQRLLLGEGMPADRSAALALYVESCKRGDVDACVVVMSAPEKVAEHRLAEAALRPHCRAGNIRACRHAARGLPGLVSELEPLCREGVVYACGRKTLGEDREAQGRACDMGDPDACDWAVRGDPASRFFRASRELRTTGCAAGFVGDCRGQHGAIATQLLSLCLSGEVAACSYVVDPDPQVADTARRFACAIDASECHRLATFRINRGDVVGARRAYETGCEATYRAGSSRAADCLEAARLSEQAPADPAAATRLRATACTLDPTSCNPKP